MAHALGIDVGTTNAKVALVAEGGRLVASASEPVGVARAGEVAEQDPEELWSAVVRAARRVTSAAPDAARMVTSVGVCSQYSSIVPVDRAGSPTADLVTYLDVRGTDRAWMIMDRHPEAFEVWKERHGIPPVGDGLSLAHMLHFQHDRPDVHDATARYLEVMDFVNLRLTGRAVATQCTVFASQLCDNRELGTTVYDSELVEMSGVESDRLPELVPDGSVIGTVRPEVATELGIPAGSEVRAGMNDSHAAAFGTGAFLRGRGGLMVGTTAVLLDTVEHLAVDLDHGVLSAPSPVRGHYLVFAENGLAGKALEHVLEQFVYVSDALGDHSTPDLYRALDDAVRAVPAGSGGVLFQPWLAGAFSPQLDRTVRGAFVNLSLGTSRVDLVRAVVEGVAHNLRWLLGVVEAFAGHSIDEIVFGGGAALSPAWAQILADVLDRPVHTLAEPDHAVARAVALMAFEPAGALSAPSDLLIPTAVVYEPISSHRVVYDSMYEQYVAAFEALRPIYGVLNRS